MVIFPVLETLAEIPRKKRGASRGRFSTISFSQDRLDTFDLQAAGTSGGSSDLRDLRAVYGRPTSVEPIKVTVQWRHNEDLKEFLGKG